MDDKTKEYYEYLDDLKESGVTNMYGASPYLEEDFGLYRKEAQKVLTDWFKYKIEQDE